MLSNYCCQYLRVHCNRHFAVVALFDKPFAPFPFCRILFIGCWLLRAFFQKIALAFAVEAAPPRMQSGFDAKKNV